MCKCNPSIRTPFCGAVGCEWPKQENVKTFEQLRDSAAAECGAKASSSPRDKFDIGQISFKAGAEWERKRSETLVEALEKLSEFPTMSELQSKHQIKTLEQREDIIKWFLRTANQSIKEYRGEQ